MNAWEPCGKRCFLYNVELGKKRQESKLNVGSGGKEVRKGTQYYLVLSPSVLLMEESQDRRKEGWFGVRQSWVHISL